MQNNRIITIILVSVFSIKSTYALSENKISNISDRKLENYFKKNSKLTELTISKDTNINLFQTLKKGTKGPLVVINGQGEQIIKYYELFYDLINKGYGPIYSMDHRGQGRSSRELKDSKKGYIKNYQDYINDFNKFLNTLDKENKYNLIAHSMGSAIVTKWLQQNQNQNILKKIILVAPMYKVKTKPFPYFLAKLISSVFCLNEYLCKSYAPTKSRKNKYGNPKNSKSTTSFNRFLYSKRLSLKYQDQFINGPTLSWTNQAFSLYQSIQQGVNIKNNIRMFIAKNDRVISTNSQIEICQNKMNNCRFASFENSQHGILFEKDIIRNKAIDLIDSFFNKK